MLDPEQIAVGIVLGRKNILARRSEPHWRSGRPERRHLSEVCDADKRSRDIDVAVPVDDNVIAGSKTALTRSRRSTVILAFSLATALLLGAVAAWAAACAGGRHRDGAPLPEWMAHSNRLERRRILVQ